MLRTIPLLFVSVLLLALSSSPGAADEPPIPNIVVMPADALNGVVLAPDQPSPIPTSVLTIVARNANNLPIPNAAVNISFSGSSIVLCPGASLNGTTDGEGRVVMPLAGGGCINNLDDACCIRINGVMVRAYRNAKSPDFDGAGGNLQVNIGDMIEFMREFAAGHGGCHDYDNNGVMNLTDFMIFSSAVSPAHGCH